MKKSARRTRKKTKIRDILRHYKIVLYSRLVFLTYRRYRIRYLKITIPKTTDFSCFSKALNFFEYIVRRAGDAFLSFRMYRFFAFSCFFPRPHGKKNQFISYKITNSVS